MNAMNSQHYATKTATTTMAHMYVAVGKDSSLKEMDTSVLVNFNLWFQDNVSICNTHIGRH